jgi:hypothetical protein
MAADDFLLFLPPFDSVRPADVTRPSNFFLSDSIYVFHPDQLFARGRIRGGELPIWNPLTGAGQPLLAQQQTAPFYPGTLLTFVLPYWESLGFVAALKLLLAAWGTYLLGRTFALGRLAALLAGVAFGFGTYLTTWLEHPHSNAYILLPWLLLLVHRVIVRGRTGDVLALGSAGGLALLAGHPQSALIVMLPAAGLAACLLVDRPASEAPGRARAAGLLAAAALLSLLIGAVMLLPFAEALLQAYNSSRGGGVAEGRIVYSFFFPEFWGRGDKFIIDGGPLNFPERTAYFGALPLALAVSGLVAKRPSRVQLFFAIAGTASFLAVIDTPLWADVVREIPGLASIQLARLLVIVSFCGAILAGFGLQRLIEGDATARKRMLTAFAVFAVLAPAAWALQQGVPYDAFDDALAQLPQQGLDGDLPEVIQFSAVLRWLTLALFGVVLLTLTVRFPQAAMSLAMVALLVSAVELVMLNRGWNPATDKSLVEPPVPDSVRFVQNSLGSGRMAADAEGFGPNVPSRYGLRDARTHGLPVLERYSRLWLSRGGTGLQRTTLRPDTSVAPRALDLFGVTRIFSPGPTDDSPLEFDGQGGLVLGNANALPRAYVAYGWRSAESIDEAAAGVATLEPSALQARPVVERIAGDRDRSDPATPARIVSDEPTEVSVEFEAKQAGLLVLHDNFYPGWKAYVDGEEADIHPANLTFRAVQVPQGRHRARFTYEPLSVRAGGLLSTLGVITVLGGAVIVGVRRRRASV